MDRWATNDLDAALDLRLEIEAGKEEMAEAQEPADEAPQS